MGRLIHMSDWERQDEMFFILIEEAGFHPEPDEADLPTFMEVANDPLFQAPIPRINAS